MCAIRTIGFTSTRLAVARAIAFGASTAAVTDGTLHCHGTMADTAYT